MARKSAWKGVCPGCGRPLRVGQLVRWTRWADREALDMCCTSCERFRGSRLYDEDGTLLGYSFLARIDRDLPDYAPIGADPGPW